MESYMKKERVKNEKKKNHRPLFSPSLSLPLILSPMRERMRDEDEQPAKEEAD